MRILFEFGLIGLLTGSLTLAVVILTRDLIFSPGLFFAAGLGLSIRLTKLRLLPHHKTNGRILAALSPVAFGYPMLVWILLLVYGIATQILVGRLEQHPRVASELIAYWVALPFAGIAGAFLLWSSVKLLVGKASFRLLTLMLGAAALTCGSTILVDYIVVVQQGIPPHSRLRELANWTALFLLGNSIMSWLYGIGLRAPSTSPATTS